MEIFDPDETIETDRMTEADRDELRTFVWMSMIALMFALLLWLGLCNHV